MRRALRDLSTILRAGNQSRSADLVSMRKAIRQLTSEIDRRSPGTYLCLQALRPAQFVIHSEDRQCCGSDAMEHLLARAVGPGCMNAECTVQGSDVAKQGPPAFHITAVATSAVQRQPQPDPPSSRHMEPDHRGASRSMDAPDLARLSRADLLSRPSEVISCGNCANASKQPPLPCCFAKATLSQSMMVHFF